MLQLSAPTSAASICSQWDNTAGVTRKRWTPEELTLTGSHFPTCTGMSQNGPGAWHKWFELCAFPRKRDFLRFATPLKTRPGVLPPRSQQPKKPYVTTKKHNVNKSRHAYARKRKHKWVSLLWTRLLLEVFREHCGRLNHHSPCNKALFSYTPTRHL